MLGVADRQHLLTRHPHFIIDVSLVAQGGQFAGRLGVEDAVNYRNFPRQGQGAGPTIRVLLRRFVKGTHPAKLELAAIRSRKALGGVKVVPVIKLRRLASGEALGLVVKLADPVTDLGGVQEPLALGLNAHWRVNQDVLPADGEKVGAFPHPALGVLALGLDDRAAGFPVEEIGRFVEEDPAELIALMLAAEHQVVAAIVLPDFWIAEVLGVVGRGFDDRIVFVLCEMNAIVAVGQVLIFPEVVEVTVAVVVMAGVEQVESPVFDDRRAGEATAAVLGIAGDQGDRQLLPVDEVAAADVAPVHRPPLGGVGVELVEDVVVALKVAETVRVVQPATGGRDVVVLAITLVGNVDEFAWIEFLHGSTAFLKSLSHQ